MSWYYLIFSAACDAFYNVFLKRTTGFFDYKNVIVVVLLLLGSVIGFKKGLDGIQMSVAMIAWSGMSVCSTVILDMVIYRTKFDLRTSLLMALCVISIIGLKLVTGRSE